MMPKQEQAVSTLDAQSLLAFYRNLPELLKTHNRQWVAFHGEELMGFASYADGIVPTLHPWWAE